MGSSREEQKSAALGRGVEIRLVEAGIGGWGQGCHSNGSGWAGGRSPLRGGGVGAMRGCQGAWQVETQRPVTGGEHGSVREDRSEGDGGARGVRPV